MRQATRTHKRTTTPISSVSSSSFPPISQAGNGISEAARVSTVLIFPDHGSYHTQNLYLINFLVSIVTVFACPLWKHDCLYRVGMWLLYKNYLLKQIYQISVTDPVTVHKKRRVFEIYFPGKARNAGPLMNQLCAVD
jgi:hypothetical protein